MLRLGIIAFIRSIAERSAPDASLICLPLLLPEVAEVCPVAAQVLPTLLALYDPASHHRRNTENSEG